MAFVALATSALNQQSGGRERESESICQHHLMLTCHKRNGYFLCLPFSYGHLTDRISLVCLFSSLSREKKTRFFLQIFTPRFRICETVSRSKFQQLLLPTPSLVRHLSGFNGGCYFSVFHSIRSLIREESLVGFVDSIFRFWGRVPFPFEL